RLTINGPDGRPVGKGSNRMVYLAVPVNVPGSGAGQLMIGGLTEDPADAPGPFGNYLAATTHAMQRTATLDPKGSGAVIETQDWDFAAAGGERIQMHLKYEKGAGVRRPPNEVRFYSAKTPSVFQIMRVDQVLEVIKNATVTMPDRVKEFSFKATGGSYSKIFGDAPRSLSWDNIVWLTRTVSLPASEAR